MPYHLNDKGEQSSFVSYLPLAHVFERALEHGAYKRGMCIYYSSGSIKNLTKDMSLAKPSMMIGVPRVYQKIYESVMRKLAAQPLPVRAVFHTAYAIKNLYVKCGGYKQLPLVDKVFGSIHNALGGNMEFIVSGSSALPMNVLEFLRVCSGARITTGYGLTEGSCGGAYNHCTQKLNMSSQLGLMSYLCEGRIIDRSDASEFSLKNDDIGELLIKGPNIALGYITEWAPNQEMPSYTPLADKDGYYHTGDLCKIHVDGTVSFIRRVSLVVKLQQGEFVDLEKVENALESSPLINCAFVHAECEKACTIAFVSVDSKVLESKAGAENIPLDDEKQIEELVYREGDKLVRTAGLKGFNSPKAYMVYRDVDWSTNANFFTPSQKKKHGPFSKAHQKEIEALWKLSDTR